MPVFRGAILQSPGFIPQPDPAQDDNTYTRFLNLTGVKNFEALLAFDKDADVLIQANADMTWQSNYGLFKFGPTGTYKYN